MVRARLRVRVACVHASVECARFLMSCWAIAGVYFMFWVSAHKIMVTSCLSLCLMGLLSMSSMYVLRRRGTRVQAPTRILAYSGIGVRAMR